MKIRVMDTEGVGLNHHTTKLHNLCFTEDGENFIFTTDYEEMKKYLQEPDILWVAHNSIPHDIPAIKSVLGIDLNWENFVDTLACSWALFPDRQKHGLESWGETVGVHKVKVKEDQWAEGDVELMKSRVIEDVKINWLMWKEVEKKLKELYG